MYSKKRIKEIISYASEHGEEKALELYGITSESFHRIHRWYKKEYGKDPLKLSEILEQIKDNYTPAELQAIAKGGRVIPGQDSVPIVSFEGDTIKFAFITDTHMGSIFFNEKYYIQALEECAKEDVQFICHAGDVCEGMSNRDGHIYELTHLGVAQQKEYAIQMLGMWSGKWFLIDGNHDRWFKKSNGTLIVKDICEALPQADYLGHDMGDISINGILIRLWHGEDSSSYATSYRVQKLVEAFTGGDKPNVLLCGHTHKQGYWFDRHIHCVSGGALSLQSSWMRSKRLANHTGFWIIEMVVNEGIAKFSPTWYPFYA